MSDLIDRQAAIDALAELPYGIRGIVKGIIEQLPSAQPDVRLSKIADLMEGTIDHFDLDDAMDLLYQIKEVLKNG